MNINRYYESKYFHVNNKKKGGASGNKQFIITEEALVYVNSTDQFIYLSSNISSTERNVKMWNLPNCSHTGTTE